MKNYIQLTKILMKSETMDNPTAKSRRILVAILGVFSILFIFIPACVLVGGISFVLTKTLQEIGGGSEGIKLILMILAGFSVVFGINVILNVFYFSNDMNYLLPLPLKPWEIIAAKFSVAYINESIMEFMIILSAMIGYMLATKITFAGIVMSVVAMFLVPVIPLVYCGIICVVGMSFTAFIKNKDAVNKITGLMMVLFAGVAILSVDMVGGLDLENYAQSLIDGSNTLYNVLLVVFAHVDMIVNASDGNVLAFLGVILINVVAIGIFLFLANKLYFKGVVDLSAAGGKRTNNVTKLLERKTKSHSVVYSYMKKEFLMLFRTPAFLMNCVLINVLWPVLIYAVYKIQGEEGIMVRLLNDYCNGNEKMQVYMVAVIVGISILITAAGSIPASAITREGNSFVFMKYIPLSLKTQLNIKAGMSVLLTQSVMTIYIIFMGIVLNLHIGNIIYYILVSLAGVVFVTYMGIVLDTVNPKLLWDDEINALRGNSTVFFCMAYAMIIVAVIFGLSFVLLEFTKLNIYAINILIGLFLLALDIVMYINCKNNCEENLGGL